MKFIRKHRAVLIPAMLLALWTLAGVARIFDPSYAWIIRIPCYAVILLGVVALATLGDEQPSS